MKAVFLDKYSICGRDTSAIASLCDEYTEYDYTYPEQIEERCRDAEIVITNKVVFSAGTMDALPSLKLICLAATGMNNVDLEAAEQRGIAVRNAVGYSTYSVAETTLCSALALLREVVYYDGYFKSGAYSASERIFNFDRPTAQIRGKNWGIVGMGNIGREVARLATAFGCEVRYFSTSGTVRDEGYPAVTFDELLAWADIVSVHCPLNARTHGLIGAAEIGRMKPSAILINVARGGIIDETALAEALDSGTIRGAALDVFSSEPLVPSSPLLKLKEPCRLLASPHNAWSTVEALDRLVACIVKNIEDFLSAQ